MPCLSSATRRGAPAHLPLIALACAVALTAGRSVGAQETASDTLLTVGHYFDLEGVSDPQISPDGSQIVFTRRWVNKLEDKYETTLWIMRSDGTHQRVFTKGSSPRWSPDGTRIAYLADGEPKGPQIFVRWVEGDPGATQITRVDAGAEPRDIKWAPDGRAIGFSMFVPKPAEWAIDMPKPPEGAQWTKAPRIVQTLHFREDRKGFTDGGYRHLYLVHTDGGPARAVTTGDWNVGARFDALSGSVGWDWTPDGRTIVVDGFKDSAGDYNYRDANLYAVDVEGGATRQLTTQRGTWRDPLVSPDGKEIVYTGYTATDQTYRTPGLYIMNIDGTNVRALTESLDRDVGEPRWAPDNSGVYFTADDHGTRNLLFVPVAAASGGGAKAGVHAITTGPYITSLGSVSKTGVAAVTRSDAERPPDVARVDLKGGTGSVVPLTHVNDAVLSRIRLGKVEEIWLTSSGGAKIQGWVVKPPGFNPAHKYPLIMEIHGGPHGSYNAAFNFMFQNFAANNFVVLYINPRGSTGYGNAFGTAISGAYPGVDYDDLMAAVDTVIGRGYIDTKNLFVGGCSGGGVLSSWVIGHTTRFAAAAVRCPVIDWISMAGETDIAFFTYNWFASPFWENPEPWLKESPLMYVGHVTTPTLIMTGELDRRTPMPQSEEFYVALKMRHIPTTLLRFDGEFHGTSGMKPTNFLRTQLYMMSWYRRYSTPPVTKTVVGTAGGSGQ